MASNNTIYYDSIGEWLINEKECQENEFCKGYASDLKLNNGKNIDVLGLKYKLNEDNISFNFFDFYGYVVDINSSHNEALQKLELIKNEYVTSAEWKRGFREIFFYVAFPGFKAHNELQMGAEKNGIGLLRLEKSKNNEIKVIEELKPNPVDFQNTRMSNRVQKSIGTFEKAIYSKNYFKEILKGHENIFNSFLRPKLDNYKRNLKLDDALQYCASDEGQKLLNYVYTRTKNKYPEIKDRVICPKSDENRIIFELSNDHDEIFKIRVTQDYFYIDIKSGKSFRIYSDNNILEFSEEHCNNPIQYEKGLNTLLETELDPILNNSYPKNKYCYCRSDEAKKALVYTYKQIIDKFPDIIPIKNSPKTGGEIIIFQSPYTGKELLKLDIKRDYFYIRTISKIDYRIYSYYNIIEFSQETSGKKSEFSLDDILNTTIQIRITEKYK
ncbi:hypothetical protein [Methanolacinia paynteri]|uniref:hypothetical protein n=1 Tax=Methanolacinia paynteri TaxID=230356 RepID=UPI00064F3A23|nr:hypothetical protein [Methanolacinia paynteri]